MYVAFPVRVGTFVAAARACSYHSRGSALLHPPPGPPSFKGRLGQLSNLTVVRYTPQDVQGLTNKDSGDTAGDLYFGLEELVTPMHCRIDPTYFKCKNGTGT